MPLHDIAIVGGGVNGCGIARDAAGRGLSVVLVERDDLASGTSQWSTKLVHGGLRYLEHHAFRLVREALIEREVLLTAAPHIVRPLRFVLPHDSAMRPAWMLRLGLFLYDHIGGRKLLPPTETIALDRDPRGAPLKPGIATSFAYSDCAVDDSRLVVLNAIDAAARGADIRVRTRCTRAAVEDGVWALDVEGPSGSERITARTLVVAAGPWVGRFVEGALKANTPAPVRLVKGSHLVTRRLYDHDHAYILQNADGRIVFTIPYEDDFTLVGTTDLDWDGDPADIRIDEAEIDYLIAAVNRHLARPLTRSDIVRTYSGVRPLYDDGASAAKDATRDYVLDVDRGPGRPTRLTIYGGKITTYRRLAEHALDKLAPDLPGAGGAWTAGAALPGGDFAWDGLEALAASLVARVPGLPERTALRFARAYGTRAFDVIGDATAFSDLGPVFGADLTTREVDHLIDREWARSADDILWRRSKLGLRMDAAARAALERHVAARLGETVA